jgi:uncharacterized membrane protein
MIRDFLVEIVKRPHPALVHFSMSLYPVSALFAILFQVQDNPDLLQTSYWCFLLSTLMLVPIAITGFLDFIRLKAHSRKAHRLLLIHLINGLLLTLAAIPSGFFFWRHAPWQDPSVFPWFLGCTLLFSAMALGQGAIAALMVYQHKLGVDGETR